jgi:hypothetical protein
MGSTPTSGPRLTRIGTCNSRSRWHRCVQLDLAIRELVRAPSVRAHLSAGHGDRLEGEQDASRTTGRGRKLPVIQSIAHPTDFSAASTLAFAHALRLALDTKSRLSLLHVNEKGSQDEWTSFPHVRETLVRWGLLNAKAPHVELEARLGIKVTKVEIRHRDRATGLFEFLAPQAETTPN